MTTKRGRHQIGLVRPQKNSIFTNEKSWKKMVGGLGANDKELGVSSDKLKNSINFLLAFHCANKHEFGTCIFDILPSL
jgi:hypothetical protein